MGMGFLHYNPELKLTEKDIEIRNNCINLDYVEGRMVKLRIRKIDGEKWEIIGKPSNDYQSWIAKYPTNEALVNSVIREA
jgi:hypothetical protein